MDTVLFESDERKAVFQFAYVREEQTGRFVEHHCDDVVRASGVELSKVSRFVNEYLYSACHVSIKNGGNFPALGWTFTPAHGAVPPFRERRTVYQIPERGARGARKSFFGGVENVANVEMLPVPMLPMGVENVANVEVLPVPMLPMANGEALRASHFMNGGKTGASHVSRPGGGPSYRHLGGGRGATALPPRGRAVDGAAIEERNDVR